MKRLVFILFFLFLQGFVFSNEFNKEIDVSIINVAYGKKALEIEFEIKNISKKDTWVCASDYFDQMSWKNEVPVLRTIEEDEGWIKIEFTSLSFKMYTILSAGSRPIWTKYQKLKSGEVLKRKVVLTSPITEENDDKYSFLKPCNNKISAEKVKDIHLVVGYHLMDLNNIENCCDRRSQKSMDVCELTLECAQNNPEKTVSKRIYRNTGQKNDSIESTPDRQP